jgi:ribosomal protein S18 acetylase RimI-like enzyme
MLVRAAVTGDLEDLARLALIHTVGGSPSDFRDRFAEDLASDGRCLLVAVEDDAVVGYGRAWWFEPERDPPANLAPRGYYLLGLVVDPDHRRRGIARSLTAERLAWVRGRGAHEVWYFTNAANTASQQLHRRLGFEEVTRDFVFPRVSFDGGVGVLCRASLHGA